MNASLPVIDTSLFAGQKVRQICWMVPDLDKGIQQWRDLFGIGPWVVIDNEGTTNRVYRGQPTNLRYVAALAHAGEVQLELIQQLSDEPSCYRDIVPADRTGMHHIAITVADYDAEKARYAALGFEMAFEAQFNDFRFGYVDTSSVLGVMTELLEDKPMLHQMWALERSLAANWDGVTRPVRTIGEIMAEMSEQTQ